MCLFKREKRGSLLGIKYSKTSYKIYAKENYIFNSSTSGDKVVKTSWKIILLIDEE